jgi:hypothetical protein
MPVIFDYTEFFTLATASIPGLWTARKVFEQDMQIKQV